MPGNKKLRLAVLTLHPIHYQAALWRRLAREPDLDLTVYFCSDYGMDTFDPVVGYGRPVEWGVPLLGGYRHVFLRNLQPSKRVDSFWCRVNPGIFPALLRGRYDALFVHSYHNFTQLAAILWAHGVGTKVLVRSEPTAIIQVAASRRRVKQLLLPWLFRQVDAFMAIGSLNREYYRHYGVSDERLFLMPYAVDNDYFFRQRDVWGPQRDQVRRELGISAGKVLLYVGRFESRKRVPDLIQAFERLGRDDTALVLVGGGEKLAAYQQYVEERRLRGVHFLGFCSQVELPRIYAMADAFVLPSQDEPWGLVVNEAMCFGLPIIASDQVGAAADLVQPGRNGYVFPLGNVEQLAQALSQTLQEGNKERQGQESLKIISRWGLEEDLAAMRQALSQLMAG